MLNSSVSYWECRNPCLSDLMVNIQSKWDPVNRHKMFQNCTENGYLFSCFQNFGEIKTSTDCEGICNSKHLYQFGLNDFYNFHERLNQSNFLIKAQDNHINYTILCPKIIYLTISCERAVISVWAFLKANKSMTQTLSIEETLQDQRGEPA